VYQYDYLLLIYILHYSVQIPKADIAFIHIMAETEPIVTQGIEPSSGESHSPPGDRHITATWGSKDGNISNAEWNDAEANKLPEKVADLEKKGEINDQHPRKRIVVVGLGMVGIAFM
jgi:nitrite reductase (NAD(P)H)